MRLGSQCVKHCAILDLASLEGASTSRTVPGASQPCPTPGRTAPRTGRRGQAHEGIPRQVRRQLQELCAPDPPRRTDRQQRQRLPARHLPIQETLRPLRRLRRRRTRRHPLRATPYPRRDRPGPLRTPRLRRGSRVDQLDRLPMADTRPRGSNEPVTRTTQQVDAGTLSRSAPGTLEHPPP